MLLEKHICGYSTSQQPAQQNIGMLYDKNMDVLQTQQQLVSQT
jgi:hypothetical protein